MSGKKRRSIREYLKVFLRELKRGLSPSSVRDKLIPHDTFYRLINLFKEEELIYKDKDGKYYFVWRREREELLKEYQEYKTAEEYEVKLEHSRKLLQERNLDLGYSMVNENKYFLQHLRTGYPEIYELYERWQGAIRERKKAEEEFKSRVEEVIKATGFKVAKKRKEGRVVSWVFYDAVEGYLRTGKEVNVSWREEGGDIYDNVNNMTLAWDQGLLGEVRGLMTKVLRTEEVREAFERLTKAREEEGRASGEYSEAVEMLIRKVKNGEPLRGHCGLCPKVLIGRKPSKGS